ncbi:hypothetical protein [Novosphingobium clariflavum]|uniref:Lipoprotein n=1 Tax=Novosphingobium clariflavum TaxID=2029884 RepID=A0ABV6S4Z4_9SPHN|nr:hypothetical protein [Novosphingobium clariflavum]
MTRSLRTPLIPLALLALPLGGCVSTVGAVVTAPVRIAGSAVDMATTSQSEADEKRGRAMRKRDEKLGKLERQYQRHLKECDRGDRDACTKARDDYAEIQYLTPAATPRTPPRR